MAGRCFVGPYSKDCSGTVSAVAWETAVRIGLFLRHVHYRRCFRGEGAMALDPAQSVHLHAPLDHREWVDGATSQAYAVAERATRAQAVFLAGLQASSGLITWQEDGLIDYIASYRNGTARALTTQQLITVADSARPLDSLPVASAPDPQP